MANLFNGYFASVFSTSETTNSDIQPTSSKYLNNIRITRNSIISIIKVLRSSRSCGPDGLPNIFWKNVVIKLATPLEILFNKLLHSRFVPPSWKMGLIRPIYKGKGAKTSVENYRPISTTDTLSRIFEKCLIYLLLDKYNKIISPSQHGFRYARSTTTNLLETHSYIYGDLNDSKPVDLISIDLSKAFDKIDHKILMYRLSDFGLHPLIVRWIHNFLTGRFQTVVIDGNNSIPLKVAVESLKARC